MECVAAICIHRLTLPKIERVMKKVGDGSALLYEKSPMLHHLFISRDDNKHSKVCYA
jgi:hypothetical protein